MVGLVGLGLGCLVACADQESEREQYVEVFDINARHPLNWNPGPLDSRGLALSHEVLRNLPDYGYDNDYERILLQGKVRNNGDRKLKLVRVVARFLGEDGEVVLEEDYHPVVAMPLGLGGQRALKPGEVREFTYGVKRPAGWAEGRVRVEVASILFE